MGQRTELSERLVKIRNLHNITRTRLAQEIDVPYGTISKYETGEREPGNAYIVKLANYWGVTTDYLLGLTEEPHGHFEVEISNIDPQIERITEQVHRLNAQGLAKLGDYAEDLVASGKYKKARFRRMNPDESAQ